MAQEEKCSNSGSGSGGGGGGCCSRSSKKMKQKKVPQRGLGVAQLEKIRLEEQHKKDAALQAANVLTPNSIISPSNSSSCLAVQCPTFRSTISSSTAVPLLPPSPTDHLPSLNSMFRPAPSIPNVEILPPKAVPLSKPLNVSSGGEKDWSAAVPTPAPAPGHGTWSRVWNGDYNLEGENQRLDHHGFRYRPNVNIAYESTTPFVPLPNLMQRSPQIQPPSPSSVVNISTGISSSPVMNFQMEPPSNQNIPAYNNYTPLWPEEEKMIGMKRPYPFSIETPPAPAFHFKYPPTYVVPTSRLDEAASCSNRSCVSTDRGFAVIRECPARPNTVSEPAKFGHGDREQGGGLHGDFLTLAPPTISSSSPQLSSKHKQSLANSGFHSCELSEYLPRPSCQGSTDDAVQGQGSSKPIHQPSFFTFFPSPKQQRQIGHSSTTLATNSNNSTDAGENIDLSLKL